MFWPQCSDGSRPSAANPGPPRRPHPSWSFGGLSPQPAPTPDPQFLQAPAARGRRAAGRGQRALPRRDWPGAWRRAGSHAGPRLRVPRAPGWYQARREAASPLGAGEGESSGRGERAPRLGGGERARSGPPGFGRPRAGGWLTDRPTCCARDTPTRRCAWGRAGRPEGPVPGGASTGPGGGLGASGRRRRGQPGC